MKIGFFTDTYFPQISGVATSIATLKEELERVGNEVYIFTTTDPRASDDDPTIIRLPSIPFVSFKERRIVVRGMYHAYHIAKEIGLDIVHTHTEFAAGILGKFIARQLDIPVVHTYHTMYEDYLHYIAKGKIVRPIHVKQVIHAYCHRLDGVICPSQRVVDTLKGYNIYVPMQVIPTGINLAKFQQSDEAHTIELKQEYDFPEQCVLLLSLSRLSYEKKIHVMIAEFPKILSQLPDVRLLIAGYGPYQEELEQLVSDLNLQNYIHFSGKVSNEDVGAYYRGADYFVSASDSESQGLTYIESMASGTQAVVKGNEYIDSLFDDLALGATFKKDEEFADTVVDYITKKHPKDDDLLKKKMRDISSETFGEKVLDFYAQAQQHHLSSYMTEKKALSLKLFKK